MRIFRVLCLLTALPLAAQEAPQESDTIHIPPKIEWEKVADIEKPEGGKIGGRGGMFTGSHGDVLILAGGSEYPDKMPWEGGSRTFSAAIHVLRRSAGPEGGAVYRWVEAGATLSQPLAYGASVSLPEGVLCMGGTTGEKNTDECFLLSWNAEKEKIERRDFPKLPKPLAWTAAVALKGAVYLMGGSTEATRGRATGSFFTLDLSKRKGGTWKTLPSWDGPGRVLPVAAGSLEGGTEFLYLAGGRDPGGDPDFLADLHRYDPVKKEWSLLGDIADPRGHPCAIVGAPAFHVPPHHLVIVSGTDESITRVMEMQSRDLAELDDAEKKARQDYNRVLMEKFPGYARTVLGYDAEIGEWNHIGNFPGEPCLTNPAVNWDGQIVIPGGETGPGRRSGEIWLGTIRKKPAVVEEEEEEPAAEPAPSGQREVPSPAAGAPEQP